MPGVRICIIGEGSAYMTSMFAALARYARDDSLAGSTVVLNDIDRENMALKAAWGVGGFFEAHRGHLPQLFSATSSKEQP